MVLAPTQLTTKIAQTTALPLRPAKETGQSEMAAAMTASSDAGFLSEGHGRLAAISKQRPSHPSSSSGRPRGPPSEILGAPSDDEGEGFADDQIPGRSRPRGAQNIPRVEDRVGLMMQEAFERFVEG